MARPQAGVAATYRSGGTKDLAERALAWLDGMPDAERRKRFGLESSTFD